VAKGLSGGAKGLVSRGFKTGKNWGMNGRAWFRIRLVLICLGFVVGIASPPWLSDELLSEIPWPFVAGALAMALFFPPIALLFVIGIQAINPWSDRWWHRPTHRSNPFRLGNPLLFFHFAVYFSAVGGLGQLASGIWSGAGAALTGLSVLIGSGSTLLGLRLCMGVYRHKMAGDLDQEGGQPSEVTDEKFRGHP